mmetsp:Transcript_73888/g.216412  ORF Transcript_73888/g.216412 Transcript_73888/m.216412 type:complete len:206 (+) Transcript_73888:180-797(+)
MEHLVARSSSFTRRQFFSLPHLKKTIWHLGARQESTWETSAWILSESSQLKTHLSIPEYQSTSDSNALVLIPHSFQRPTKTSQILRVFPDASWSPLVHQSVEGGPPEHLLTHCPKPRAQFVFRQTCWHWSVCTTHSAHCVGTWSQVVLPRWPPQRSTTGSGARRTYCAAQLPGQGHSSGFGPRAAKARMTCLSVPCCVRILMDVR